jgi:uncharacterized membrane protein YjjP (DUF1212 family)
MLASPVFLLGSTVATVWAALFHLLLGKKWRELVLYWFAGLVGFAIGQAIGNALDLDLLLFGQVRLLEGTLACWLAMAVARCFKV